MRIAPNVFTGGVVHRAVTGECLSYFPVDPAFVRAEMGVGREHFGNDGLDRLSRSRIRRDTASGALGLRDDTPRKSRA